MKKSLLLSFLVFYFSLSYCQDTYKTLNGQTINGTVENKEWAKNPASVIFNEEGNGNKITLTPENCKGFTAGSDTYISYHGKRIANSPDVILNSKDESDSLMRDTVNVFLRQIYNDKKYVLYELNDAKRLNFYLSIDGKIKELEYYETLAQNESGTFEGVPHNIYKSYLYQEFSKRNIPPLPG